MIGEFIAHDLKFQVWELKIRALWLISIRPHAACRQAASKVCFRGKTEVGREAKPADSVEDDPKRSLPV